MSLNAIQKLGTTLMNTKIASAAQESISAGGLKTDVFQKSSLEGLEGYSKKVQERFLSVFEEILRNSEKKEENLAIFKKLTFKYQDEKSILQYLDNVQTLNAKKTPKGEHILDMSDVLYLAGARLTKKQQKEFKLIIRCAQDGYMPASVLNKGLFRVSDGINPNFLEDYKKIASARKNGTKVVDEFVPEFQSIPKMAKDNVFERLEAGSFVSVKDGFDLEDTVCMIKSKDRYSIMDINKRTLLDILPPIKRFYVQQGQSGTCYQLASYISYLNHPKARADLVHRVHTAGDKTIIKMPYGSQSENLFKGKFSDFTKDGSVLVELTRNSKGRLCFTPPNAKQSVDSNTLVNSLEFLYGKKRKFEFANEYVRQAAKQGLDAQKAYNEACLGMEQYIYQKDSKGNLTRTTLEELNKQILAKNPNARTYICPEDFYKEGGTTSEIFEFLSDGKYQKPVLTFSQGKTDKATLDKLRKILSEDNKDTIKCFGTIPAGQGVENGLVPKKHLYSSHGYSILDYDPKTDIITYINPWNSTFIHEMPLKDMAQYIYQISTMRIR